MSKDGGPAFPTSPSSGSEDGMTLRDWFAGQSLSGLVAWAEHHDVMIPAAIEDLPRAAYNLADAMLKERERVK